MKKKIKFNYKSLIALFWLGIKLNSMSKNSSSSSSGIGVLGLLGIAFIVLKLIGTITWSWWWVTLPFWGGIALVLLVLLVIVILMKHN